MSPKKRTGSQVSAKLCVEELKLASGPMAA
jgi:hypothetical protein